MFSGPDRDAYPVWTTSKIVGTFSVSVGFQKTPEASSGNMPISITIVGQGGEEEYASKRYFMKLDSRMAPLEPSSISQVFALS